MRLGAALLLLAVAAATPEIRYFRYERPVSVTSHDGSGSAQTCAVLDASTFEHAAADLGDLRLYHDHSETPYVIRTDAPARAAEQKIAALNLGTRAGQTTFDAAMPNGQYSDVSLDVSGANFIATVTVTGTHDEGHQHETRLGAYTIFDLTDQKLGRSTVLHLPPSDFRYLHFAIAGPVKPQQIGGMTVGRVPATQPHYLLVAERSQVAQD
ncbi:MAG TPA: hypothetical protein VJV22_00025, partial [Acidobacteriaceae bacterium]|nr:hypothetical protein [Acidobacteriaceae bacterium]